jgi:thiol-disulfide isomerase/thioredoxin
MQQLDDLKARCKDKMVAILFWAIWYPECEEMRKEFEKLAEHLSHIRLFWCDVDNDKEIIDTYEVYKVPYILLMHVSTFLANSY